jgi:putative aldouronate transport system permease protein
MTARRKFKIAPFTIFNYIFFIFVSLLILIPLWKVLIDSIDMKGAYSFSILPREFTISGYKAIVQTQSLYQPFVNSVTSTIFGTLLGLTMSTLAGYVLIQFKMPGRGAMAYFVLFTMIFSGGMIPEYLVMRQLHLMNTFWIVPLIHAVDVYNLVLMRNFFEGIPGSLFEAAEIDGCSPFRIFIQIVLPLSKAALASIGLMYAVALWNDYTNFKIYITDHTLVNFQYKLRNLMVDGDTPNTAEPISTNMLKNAAIMSAIIPFMIVYPFCQKYFVKGVNIGAVKE